MNKAIVGLVVLCIAGTISLFPHEKPQSAFVTEETARMAASLQDEGVISADHYVRLVGINDKIVDFGGISDQDLSWSLNTMRAPLSKGEQNSALLHMEVLARLRRIRNLTGAQKEKIFDAALPLLSSPDASGLDQIQAAKTMRTLGDTRAIPYLRTLLLDRRPSVAGNAKQSLTALGDSHTSAARITQVVTAAPRTPRGCHGR